MNSFFKFSTSIFVLFTLWGQAQTLTNSPYSRYGLGELNTFGINQNFALGGLGAALINDTIDALGPYFINSENPASYSSIKRTTIEAAGNNKTLFLKSSTESINKNIPGVGYVALAFPIAKWWTTAAGLSPYSNVGYKISDSKLINGYFPVEYLYEGAGNLSKVWWGNGFAYKRLSGGFNSSLLFGQIDQTRKIIMPEDSNAVNIKTSSITRITNIVFNYGLQYSFKINSIGKIKLADNSRIILGVSGNAKQSIAARNDILSTTYLLTSLNSELVRDTLQNFVNKKGEIVLPSCWNMGITFINAKRLMIGIEYGIQDWQNFKFFDDINELKQASHIRAGFQYLPNANVSSTFWKKIYYRGGMRYEKLPLYIKNTHLTETAISLGIGIPVARVPILAQSSIINFGLEVGQMGTTNNNLIQQHFIKVSLGVTLNSKWFNPPKIN